MYTPSIGAPGHIVSPVEVLPGERARTFAVGQRLQGAVMRVVPHGGVLVNFDGQPVLLALAQAVVPGQILTATVAQVSPALLLHLTDELPPSLPAETTLTLAPELQEGHRGGPSASQLQAYVIANQPLGVTVAALGQMLSRHSWLDAMAPALTQALRDTLAVLSPHSALPPDAAQLKAQVDRSGLNYESKVQGLLMGEGPSAGAVLAKDLKGQLLELSRRLELLTHAEPDLRGREAAAVLAQVKRATDALEFQQLSNQCAWQEHRPLVLPLVHAFAPPSQTVQVTIQHESHQEGRPAVDQEHYAVALSLDLSALGLVHIKATVRGAAVAATFQVADPVVAEFLRAALPEVHARLQALGLTPCVACALHESVTPDSEGCFPRSLTRAVKLVDVKV